MNAAATRGFYKLCLITLVAVYFLIGVGSIVRTLGAGMGCPDWPKCFGQWVPPTDLSQLPSDYKETNTAFRLKKNEKFAKFLSLIGQQEQADKLLHDPSILVESDFNATKTWIEYLNRLTGVVIGLLIIGMVWRSFKIRQSHPTTFRLSLVILITVLIQGWFGSIVVSSNLTTWTITLHFFLALLMVALLVYLLATRPYNLKESGGGLVSGLLVAAIILMVVQVFLGTQVRAEIDMLASAMVPRNGWISQLGNSFIIHRSFSWVILLVNALLIYLLTKTSVSKVFTRALIVLILSSVLSGTGMAYGGVPAFLQPVHLVLATVTIGLEMYLFFRWNAKTTVVLN